MTNRYGWTRRRFVGRMMGGLGVAAGVMALGRARRAAAQDKVPKNAVAYQDEPKVVDGVEQRCDNCRFYIQPEGDAAVGGCELVSGEIAPQAWCNIWSPAPS
jgi:hypothetical protein